MPIEIHWLDKIIHVPKDYLTLVGGTLYELDTDKLRLDLKVLEASVYGIVNVKTHNHNTSVTVAGITYARTISILFPYSIEFEDGRYSVRLVGSNNNIFDVGSGILVQNQVQVIPTNAAGLITVVQGSGVTEQDKVDIARLVWASLIIENNAEGSAGEYVEIIKKITSNKVTKAGDVITIFEANGSTVWRQYNLALGGRVEV